MICSKISICVGMGLRETTTRLDRRVSVSSEMWTKHLPNTWLKRYRYINLIATTRSWSASRITGCLKITSPFSHCYCTYHQAQRKTSLERPGLRWKHHFKINFKQSMRVVTGLIWLRIWKSVGFLRTRYWSFSLHRRCGMSRVIEQLLASQIWSWFFARRHQVSDYHRGHYPMWQTPQPCHALCTRQGYYK